MRLLAAVAAWLLLVSAVARADVAAPSRVTVGADRLVLAEPIAFDAGKATLKAQSQPLLEEVARVLSGNRWIELVEVGVHSDERGADEYNLRMSADRAAAVVAWLVAHGVPATRLQARGYGETQPLCREHNEACWSRNRRTELLVVKGARR